MAKSSSRKPEADVARDEVAHQQEDQGASVTDSVSTVPGDVERDGEGHPVDRGEEVETADSVIDLLDEALSELGEPDGSYPAPIVNAIALLRSAQSALQAEGLEVVGTLETITESVEMGEVEVFSPGQPCPTSGLYRAVGVEAALSEGDRFPPPSMAFGWVLFQAADQEKGGKA